MDAIVPTVEALPPDQRTLQACTSANTSNQAHHLVPNGRVRLVAPPVVPGG